MSGHSARRRDYSHQSLGRNSVWSRTPRRGGLPVSNVAKGFDANFCKLFPFLCPPQAPTKHEEVPDPTPTPTVKSTVNTPVPPSTVSSTHPETQPPPAPTPPQITSTPSPTPTPTPTVTSTKQDPSLSVPSTESNSASSTESSAEATQISNSSPIPVSESTHAVVSTELNGQITTRDVVSTVPVPITTSGGIPLVLTTNSLGSTLTVPYGLDPSQTSLANDSNDGTTTTTPATANGAAAKDINVGEVVGGILGGIALLVLLILGFCLIRRRRRALRTAPSAEFLGQGQYPFSGSAQFQFHRSGSLGFESDGNSVMDVASPTREWGPDPFNAHSEKAEPAY